MENQSYWRGTARTVLTLFAITAGAVYLVARATTLGDGWLLAISVPLYVAELVGFAQLALFAFVAWHAYENVPDATNGPSRSSGATRPVITDLVIDVRDQHIEDLEKTLVGVQHVHGVGVVLVVDNTHRDAAADTARALGARYVAESRADTRWVDVMLDVTRSDQIGWLVAGQVPMPDFVEEGSRRLADPKVGVWQSAFGLFNSDSFAHVQRGRDEEAVVRSIIAPGLDLFGAAPWSGPGSVLRRTTFETLRSASDEEPVTSQRLIMLHRAGWTSATSRTACVRTTAPDDLDGYLTARRTRARAAFAVLFSRANPVFTPGLSMLQRIAHLTMVSLFVSGIRQAVVVAILITTLVTGLIPLDGSLGAILSLWLVASSTGTLARRVLAGDSMRVGDWTKHGWRTMGADFTALMSVPGTSRKRTTESREATGIRSLGRLRLLTVTVVALDVALLARGATIVFESALPAFTISERLLVISFGLALLVPMIDVLHLVVARRQRRKSVRLDADLDVTIGDTAARTIDLSTSGVGLLLPFSPVIDSTVDLRLDLPTETGALEAVDVRGVVRAASRDNSGLVRVGVEFLDPPPRARHALIRFCTADPSRAEHGREVAEPHNLSIDRPEAHRVHTIRVLTAMASAVSIALLFLGPSAASAATEQVEQTETFTLRLVDSNGEGIADVDVRAFAGDAVRWSESRPTTVEGRATFSSPGDFGVRPESFDIRWNGARMVIPVANGETTVFTGRIDASAVEVDAIDTGAGWRTFSSNLDVLPGPIAIRLADGSVVKVEISAGHVFDVANGTESPIEYPAAPTLEPSTTTEPATTTEAPTTLPPTTALPTTAAPPATSEATADQPSTTAAQSEPTQLETTEPSTSSKPSTTTPPTSSTTVETTTEPAS